MIEYLTSIFVPIILIAPFAIFVRQIQQVRNGIQSRIKATLWFVILAICPLLGYVLLIAALVAVEEITKLAVIEEGIARTFFFVMVIGLGEIVLLTVVFSIIDLFVGGKK